MKTIEEHNNEARETKVSVSVGGPYATEWEPMGIMCPCGCREELLKARFPCTITFGFSVKCQKTNRIGLLKFSDSLRGVISHVEWR